MSRKCHNIFLISMLIHMVFILILSSHGYRAFLMDDSYSYLPIAQNLVEYGTYSMDRVNLIPSNFRTPLYPLFLVPFVISNTPLFFVAVVQSVLASFAAVFIYILGRRIFTERVAIGAALLFAVEPSGVFISSMILTEALFIFFFVPALLFCFLFVKEEKGSYLIYSAVFLALASLTRPVAFYFIFLIPLAVLLTNWRKIPWRATLTSIILFYLVLSPWLVYNAVKFSVFQISSNADIVLYDYHAAWFERWINPDAEPTFTMDNKRRIVGEEKFGTVAGDIEAAKTAKRFIVAHPLQYAFFHLLYTPRLFIHSGYVDIYEKLFGTSVSFSSISIYGDVTRFNFNAVVNKIMDYPVMLTQFIPKLLFITVAILAFSHWFIVRKDGDAISKISTLATILITFYALLSSPLGQERLRFIIHPILFLLAIDALRIIKTKHRNKLCFLARGYNRIKSSTV